MVNQERESCSRPLDIARLSLFVPACVVFIIVCARDDFHVDMWHRVTTGREVAQTGQIPQVDRFTCSIAGERVVNQCWLMDLAFYELFELGGFKLLLASCAVAYAVAFALLTHLAYRVTSHALAASTATLLGVVIASNNLGPRSQAIAFLLFALEYWILAQPGPPARASVPGLFVINMIWANSHGSFFLGMALPILFFAADMSEWWSRRRVSPAPGSTEDEDARPSTLWVGLANILSSIAGALMTPEPFEVIRAAGTLMSRATSRGIEEWLPTTSTTLMGRAFFVSIIALIVSMGWTGIKLRRRELVTVAAFLWLGAGAIRMVAWWGLALAPVIARPLARVLPALEREENAARSMVPVALAGLLSLVLLFSTPWTKDVLSARAQSTNADLVEPSEIADVLQDDLSRQPQGAAVFCPMEWGAYLTWKTDGRAKVFIDGRIDFFPDDVWRDYVTIGQALPGWEGLLDRRGIDRVVWNKSFWPSLPAGLARSPEWRKVHEDATGWVFVRARPQEKGR